MRHYDDLEKYEVYRHHLADRALGCLIGGAAGDALGYAVEFDSLLSILKRYPGRGITEFELDADGLAPVSDDTQMSLFTFEGMLRASKGRAFLMKEYVPFLTQAYLDWYATQTEAPHHLEGSDLSDIPALWSRRAPGNTCLSALHAIRHGEEVSNSSKGCGGVMRVAPIAITAQLFNTLTIKEAAIVAGYAAEITHKHPLSTYSSAILVYALTEILRYDPTPDSIDHDWMRTLMRVCFYEMMDWYGATEKFRRLEALVNKALDLAVSDLSDTAAIRQLGEGWVAEETLAIAVFSVMRYLDDFEKCIVCAVNHDGDSDSTGAVAGNLIGAIVGYDRIPEKFKRNLELAPEIHALLAPWLKQD